VNYLYQNQRFWNKLLASTATCGVFTSVNSGSPCPTASFQLSHSALQNTGQLKAIRNLTIFAIQVDAYL